MVEVDTHNEPRLSESDVQAFADGLLDSRRAAQMQRYLASRPDEAKRVAFYHQINWQMQNSFQKADEDATVAAPPLRLRWTMRRLRPYAVALALAVGLIGTCALAFHVSDAALDNASVMALEKAIAAQQTPPAENGYATDEASLHAAPDLRAVGLHVVAERKMSLGLFSHATEYVYWNYLGQAAVLLTATDPTVWPQPQWRARRVGGIRLLVWSTVGKRHVLAGRAETRGLMLAADLMTGH
jgi:anti-sigma factor RsiW